MRIAIIGGTGTQQVEVDGWESHIAEHRAHELDRDTFLVTHLTKVQADVKPKHRQVYPDLCFLPRHHNGRPPHKLNHKGNIRLLRSLGVDAIIGLTACGSLDSSKPPGWLYVPSDFVDLTRYDGSFLDGQIEHPLASPSMDTELRDLLRTAARDRDYARRDRPVHGTLVSIRGPRLSTKAESVYYINQGWTFINMTTAPEANLCLELGIPYALLAGVTDYDVGLGHDEVPFTQIMEMAAQLADKMTETVIAAAVSYSRLR